MGKDKYHEVVKKALIKDGWTITHDPLLVDAGTRTLKIDLGAEELLGAERNGEKIAVEIKGFIGLSSLHEFYKAVGQFDYYLFALEKQEADRVLFLALPSDFYGEFIDTDAYNQEYVASRKFKLIVYHIQEEKIIQWIK